MYSTYQQYQKRGGKLPEEQYLVNAQKACELIDYYTMGRAASASKMQDQLSACECDLVDRMKPAETASAGIQSENNDGYSVTFFSRTERKAELLDLLKRHLTFPENLLALSGWAFV